MKALFHCVFMISRQVAAQPMAHYALGCPNRDSRFAFYSRIFLKTEAKTIHQKCNATRISFCILFISLPTAIVLT